MGGCEQNIQSVIRLLPTLLLSLRDTQSNESPGRSRLGNINDRALREVSYKLIKSFHVILD